MKKKNTTVVDLKKSSQSTQRTSSEPRTAEEWVQKDLASFRKNHENLGIDMDGVTDEQIIQDIKKIYTLYPALFELVRSPNQLLSKPKPVVRTAKVVSFPDRDDKAVHDDV